MVTITHSQQFPIAMPSQEQLVSLLAISRSSLFPKAPPLNARDAELFFTEFNLAFGFLSTVRRTPDLRDRIDTWLNRASNWAAERHSDLSTIGASSFLCACASHGDIGFQFDHRRWPFDIMIGLSWSEGLPASALGWQSVLSSRKVRESVPIKHERAAPHPLLFYPNGT